MIHTEERLLFIFCLLSAFQFVWVIHSIKIPPISRTVPSLLAVSETLWSMMKLLQ